MNIFLSILLLVLPLSLSHLHVTANDHESTRDEKPKAETYIIHMDKSVKPAIFGDLSDWYHSSLKAVSDSAQMLYTYNNVFHGFSASITPNEAELLENQPGVVSVTPETIYEGHTTRTPDFLGLTGKNAPLFPKPDKVSDVVIGVLDSGVWPERKSYNDADLGPVPKSWKGACEVGNNFASSSCNKKLIGARFFSKGYEKNIGHPVDEKVESNSPRDDTGHGTHTSTIAAGSAVAKASLFGYALGTARGMATSARVATYKVCWLRGCAGSDVIAGIDKAIEDGVNIISMSIGLAVSKDYRSDSYAIAAFAAASRGIFVSTSAGNSGPHSKTLTNVAPWVITVGAGTIDRDFPAYVKLGNGKEYKGVGIYHGDSSLLCNEEFVPIVYAGGASNNPVNGSFCLPGTLDRKKVTGKIVICDQGKNLRTEKGLEVKDAGGVGMILTKDGESNGEEIRAEIHIIPTCAVSVETGNEIKNYVDSTAKPTATIIFKNTVYGVQPSPIVAAFSSRGPNSVTPEILKPDIIAPGVSILAAWTGAVGPTGLATDKRRVDFNIRSGTSMACPHVSGVAALLKATHPDWSPAAIRSALMTTAYSTKNGKTIEDVVTASAATPFDFGAGHVDPAAALSPGLVYDATVDDYINFLCALKYTAKQIKVVTGRDFNCDPKKNYRVGDLNYPSFAVILNASPQSALQTVTYTRILTNVGSPATFSVSVSKVNEVDISVQPKSMSFTKANEKKTYTVTFKARSMPSGTTRFARLEWSGGKSIVGSPIAFSWSNLVSNIDTADDSVHRAVV